MRLFIGLDILCLRVTKGFKNQKRLKKRVHFSAFMTIR